MSQENELRTKGNKVGLRGLEPPWVTPTDPKSVASASFATGPLRYSTEKVAKNERKKCLFIILELWRMRDRDLICKFLFIIYMPKEPKFRRGFTWRHHIDEKWDRLDYGFKLGWQICIFVILLGGAFGLLVWANRRSEREEWLREGARQELLRKEKSSELIQRGPPAPPLRPAED